MRALLRRSLPLALWALGGCARFGEAVVGGAAPDAGGDGAIDGATTDSASTDSRPQDLGTDTTAMDAPRDVSTEPPPDGTAMDLPEDSAPGDAPPTDGPPTDGGCLRDEDCTPPGDGGTTSTPVCDPVRHVCVGCVRDAHCPSGMRCAGDRCVLGCADSARCAAGQLCCEGLCVDVERAAAHCGRCGRACVVPGALPACRAGVCAVERCEETRADCDGDARNGCEVELRTDPSHCGACGAFCPSRPRGSGTCVGGLCGLRCDLGQGDCNGEPSDGCETSLTTSVVHCGRCGNRCAGPPHTVYGCASGRCMLERCEEGFGDCNGDPADGCEAELRRDRAHCGACGVACPAGAPCADGACGGACAPGSTACAGRCVDLSSDPAHCGACAAPCPTRPGAAALCALGRCGYACEPGRLECNRVADDGCEVRSLEDPAHCGGCNQACPAGARCVGSRCVL